MPCCGCPTAAMTLFLLFSPQSYTLVLPKTHSSPARRAITTRPARSQLQSEAHTRQKQAKATARTSAVAEIWWACVSWRESMARGYFLMETRVLVVGMRLARETERESCLGKRNRGKRNK